VGRVKLLHPSSMTERAVAEIASALKQAGLAVAIGPAGVSLDIVDRERAVRWFAQALAEYDHGTDVLAVRED